MPCRVSSTMADQTLRKEPLSNLDGMGIDMTCKPLQTIKLDARDLHRKGKLTTEELGKEDIHRQRPVHQPLVQSPSAGGPTSPHKPLSPTRPVSHNKEAPGPISNAMEKAMLNPVGLAINHVILHKPLKLWLTHRGPPKNGRKGLC